MAWKRFFRRERWDRERRAEIESYVQIETDDNLARGMSEPEARAAARRKLGNSTLVREEIYRMNTLGLLDSIWRDLRLSLRLLRRTPTFTAVAVLTLAIGIGANTAVFSVVNSILLKPLAYPKPDQVVAVWHKAPGAAGLTSVSGDLRLSPSMYFTYAEQNHAFQSLGVWAPDEVTVTGQGDPERVPAVYVSDGALEALAVPPILGRWLSHADQIPNGPARVMLDYGYWQRRFGGDPSVVGHNILISSRPFEIVGVMPSGFTFANASAGLILPIAFDRAKVTLPGFGFQCVARLKPGVTIAQANADIARLVPVWMLSWPSTNDPKSSFDPHEYEAWHITPAIRPLQQDVVGSVSSVLWVVMGTIAMVMLIVCANVANLLLVRAEARQQELAVRAALGAGWARIVRELLVESVLLSLIGGALGLLLAGAGLRFLIAIGPGNLPRLSEISVDARALAFTFAVSLISGIAFGLIPSWKYGRAGISIALRGGGRTLSQSRERHRTRNILVVCQVALAMVLLISAGLMIRTFQSLHGVQPGFTHGEQLQVMRISIPSAMAQGERVARMQNDILGKLADVPGVSSVGFASEMPLENIPPDWDAIRCETQPLNGAQIPPMRMFQRVSPGFFHTAGTRLVAGREYTWTDLYGKRPVAILSENLARELFGSPSAAIGKRIAPSLPNSPLNEVVGVVEDVRQNGVQEPAPATVYWPAFGPNIYHRDETYVERDVTFVIRSARAGSPSFLQQIHQAVRSINSALPLASVQTMRDVYARSLARAAFTLVMLVIASCMALVLGIIGIYGVISYAVSQRRREIGIRVALGARPAEVNRMFVTQGLTLTAIGLAIGLGAAAALTGLMKSLLFGISPLDPPTYLAVPAVLAIAAALSSYLPARRAARVDPVVALKEQ